MFKISWTIQVVQLCLPKVMPRVQASLNSGVGDRVDLWQEDNFRPQEHPNYQEEECSHC